MGKVDSKCAMVGCKRPVHKSLPIGPGTVVGLCAEHYAEEKRYLDNQKAA